MAPSMTVAVSLSDDGAPRAITLENVSGERPDLVERLFRPPIEGAMKESRFDAACGGKTIRFVFSFQMGRDHTVYFLFPNRFEIEATPSLVQTAK